MKSDEHGLRPGEVAAEQLNLLLAGTAIKSASLIAALKDHLVLGMTRAESCGLHGVNLGLLSRRIKVLRNESIRARALSRFYAGKGVATSRLPAGAYAALRGLKCQAAAASHDQPEAALALQAAQETMASNEEWVRKIVQALMSEHRDITAVTADVEWLERTFAQDAN